jgi:hypothetical protein
MTILLADDRPRRHEPSVVSHSLQCGERAASRQAPTCSHSRMDSKMITTSNSSAVPYLFQDCSSFYKVVDPDQFPSRPDSFEALTIDCRMPSGA